MTKCLFNLSSSAAGEIALSFPITRSCFVFQTSEEGFISAIS